MADNKSTTFHYNTDTIELGNTGLNRYGGFVYEEFLPQLRFPEAARIYKEMSDNDPTIGAILFATTQLIKQIDWTVKPGGDKKIDQKAAEFLQQCMDDMSMSWDNTIAEILSMIPYGFSFHEVVYKIRRGPAQKNSKYRSKYNDGRVGWGRIPVRAQSTLYKWEIADNGDVKGFYQLGPPNYTEVYVPLAKGLLFRTDITRDNPEGKSLLRNAYRPWYFKKRIEEIEGIGIERDLAGLPVLTPPEDIDIWDPTNPDAVRVKSIAESLVKSIRRDRSEGVVKPHGWDLALLSTGGSRQFDTSSIINRYDHKIAITMLADIVMMGGDKVGSFALGEVKKSMFASALEAVVQHIADVFNKFAVPKLFSMNNFPGLTDVPQIVPGAVEVPDMKDLAFLLRAGGMRIDKDLGLMNLIRRMITLDPITQDELDVMYAQPEPPKGPGDPNAVHPNEPKDNSQNADPVGHAADDNTQLK